MKKAFTSFFTLLLLTAAMAITAQVKPKLAVFVVGMDDWKRGDVVAHIVGEELNRDKTYQVVTRSGAVQVKLKALRRASGGVKVCELREWCKAHGIDHLCLITSMDNQNFSAQLLDMANPQVQLCSSCNHIAGFGAVDLKELAWALTTQLNSDCPRACSNYCETSIGMEMVYVEGGVWKTSWWGDRPLKDYWIGTYEVTQREWEAVKETSFADYCKKNSIGTTVIGPDYPAYGMTGYEMYGFCEALSARTGKTYRVTTEAEWEYAARGGKFSKGYTYSGSNNVDDVAWYSGNSGGAIHAVGAKAGNELGIHDMSGNVWELGGSLMDGNPTVFEPSNNNHRVYRGGSYTHGGPNMAVTSKTSKRKLWQQSGDFGFRVV